MNTRDFIKQIPSKVTGIIFGVVLFVNAKPLADLLDMFKTDFREFVEINLQLGGGILIGLSILNLLINYYLAVTEEQAPFSKDEE